jgi:hypothetical protein
MSVTELLVCLKLVFVLLDPGIEVAPMEMASRPLSQDRQSTLYGVGHRGHG